MNTKSTSSQFISFMEVNRIAVTLIISLVVSLRLGAQDPTLLADTYVGDDLIYDGYSHLTNANGRFYFVGHGKELWTADPVNPDQLILLRTFVSISALAAIGNNVFFVADDGVTGAELWKSNGSVNGTMLVKDIQLGGQGSSPDHLTNVRGVLYFSAKDAVNGRELWKSNGTRNGTVLVKDVLPKGKSSNPTSLTEVNGSVFFAANDGVHGIELWKSNGSAEGTRIVKDINPGVRVNSSPSDLVNVYGTLFFVAGDNVAGRELWKSDGTEAGTVRVKDILPGLAPSRIKNATAVYRTLFFSATDGVNGQELWKSDGTPQGTRMVKDLTPGAAGSSRAPSHYDIGNFKNIYGTLFFTAYQNQKYFVWKSNGTEKGTVPLFEAIGPGQIQPKPQFTFYNNRIYYFNLTHDESQEGQLVNGFWMMDMNGENREQITTFQTYSPTHSALTLVNRSFYLTGSPSDYMFSGIRLLRSEGTAARTWVLENGITMRTGNSNLSNFTRYNGRIFFRTDHSYYSNHVIWVTDGTPQGTYEFVDTGDELDKMELIGSRLFASIKYQFGLYSIDLNSGQIQGIIGDYSRPVIRFMTQANGVLYFSTGEGVGELWKSDGSASGTTLIKAFDHITALHAVGGSVLIRVVENGREELWRSTGTVAGTTKLRSLSSGTTTTEAGPSAVIGNTLYFVADDGVHGSEVWKSDGTASGTAMVTDLRMNDSGENDIRHLAAHNDALIISALGKDGRWAIYTSEGTSSGTALLQHADPILGSVATSEKLYLFGHDPGTSAPTLWTTDGSADGTGLVKRLAGVISNLSYDVISDVVYFSMSSGGTLWRSDGTACGTSELGISSKGASPIMALNNTLIFGSDDAMAGYEPHALNTATLPGNPCTSTAASVRDSTTGTETTLSSYPNPFTNHFTFRVASDALEGFTVKAVTLHGETVEDIGLILPGAEQQIGQSWKPGIYVLQITNGSRRTSFMMRKE